MMRDRISQLAWLRRVAPLLLFFLVTLLPATGAESAEDLLTREERAWLANHQVIRLAYETRYAPFSFIDAQGRISGLSVEYIRLLEQKLGIRFQIVAPDSLAVNLEKVRTGEVDLLTSVMKTPERSGYLLFTKPYLVTPAVIIVRTDYRGAASLDRMKEARIAVGADYAVAAFLRNQYPFLTLVPVMDDRTALRMLSFGEVDAAVVDMASASHIIQAEGIGSLRVAGETGFTYDLSLASRSEWPTLNRILEKGLAAISEKEAKAIKRRWVPLETAAFVSRSVWLGLLALLTLAGVALAVIMIWNRTLARMVGLRTAELREELAERHRVEEELRESRIRHQSLFETLPLGVVYQDAAGAVVAANAAAERILGMTGGGAPERPAVALCGQAIHEDGTPYPCDSYPCMVAMTSGTAAEKAVMGIYHPARQRQIWIEVTSVPLFHPGNSLPHMVYTIFEEITSRKEMEAKLRDYSENLELLVSRRTAELEAANRELELRGVEAEGANRAKSAFLSTMSHELRTPLHAILGLSEILREGVMGGLAPEQRKALATIEESGRHLLAIINDILDLTQIESERLELQPQEIDIADLCAAALKQIRNAAEAGKVSLGSRMVDAPLTLYSDPRRLRQILGNLLANAVKFTPAGGSVTLTVTGARERDAVRFEVADSGIGIAPAELDRLFQPFYQVDSRLSRQYEGSGLGLTLVARLTSLLGGEVSVESEPGEGSRFTVIMPVRATAEHAAPSVPRDTQADAEREVGHP